MKPFRITTLLLFLIALTSSAQNNFTYQGRLTANGSSATGPHDFEFRLFTAAAGGLQVGSVLSRDDIAVTDGLFTVALDFGAGAFPGADRFLAISVRPGASTGAYTALTPRQQLTPAPYAITAASFSGTIGATQLSGTYTSPVTFNNAANTFTGNGAGLTGVNASQLNGQAGDFYRNAANLTGTVAPDRLPNLGIDDSKLAPASVTTDKLAPLAVTDAQIANGAVSGLKIQDGTVSNDDVHPLANIDPVKIGAGTVSSAEFAALDGVSGPLQSQLNQKLNLTGGSLSGPVSLASAATLNFPSVASPAPPMIHMFSGGFSNADRAVIAHSLEFPNWGLFYTDATDDFQFRANGSTVVTVDLAGRIGIGRVPLLALEVEGNASKSVAGSWLANSDRRIKEDIRPLTNALATLSRLRPVGFRYTDDYLAAHPSLQDTEYFNVVAQEFAEVFPDAVQAGGDQLPDGEPILQVDTYPATIYSIAAIQELEQELRARDERIAALEQKLTDLAGQVERLSPSSTP